MNLIDIPIFKELFGTISKAINTSSFLISLATLVVAIRFRKRLRAEIDKKSLAKQGERLTKTIKGYAESLSKDLICDDKFLQEISIELQNTISRYSCMSFSLKHYINSTVRYIEKTCLKTDISKRTEIIHPLSVKLNKIVILLEKEI